MFSFFKSKKVDEEEVQKLIFVLGKIKKLQIEDAGNFVCLQIFALNNNDRVCFKEATQLFFKVLYCGNVVVQAWNQEEYSLYDQHREIFNLFQEDNGDHSFCIKVNVKDTDVATTLEKALAHEGFSQTIDPKRNDVFMYLI